MPGRFNLEDYVDVQQRENRFWTEYPDGRIDTALMSLPDEFERVVFKASVYKHRDHAVPSATGWAAETAGTGGANQTSWHENCETSAIGRALANMGYATSGKDRPSRQEMEKANRGAPAHDRHSHIVSKPGPQPIYQALDINRETGEIKDEPDPTKQLIDKKGVVYLWTLAGKKGIEDDPDGNDELHTYLIRNYGKTSTKLLTIIEARNTLEWLKSLPDKPMAQQGMTGMPAEPAQVREYVN